MQPELVQTGAWGVSALAILNTKMSAFSGEQRAFWENKTESASALLSLLCIAFSLLLQSFYKQDKRDKRIAGFHLMRP